MNKQEFLTVLRQKLAGLPQEDIEERLAFYSEMIDDRAEEGLSQAQAVAAIGSPEEIAAQVIADTPLPKLVKERVRPKRRLKVWEIILLVLGAPLWLSLLLAGAAVIFAVYIVLWSLLVALWAAEASLIVCAPCLVVAGAVLLFRGFGYPAAAALGTGLLCAGLAVFLFFGCKAASKGIILLTKKIASGVKSLFIRKENAA